MTEILLPTLVTQKDASGPTPSFYNTNKEIIAIYYNIMNEML
ncbi:hypothetical protein [Rickettsia australis]|uniref:Ankyrin repeat-containing protein n=1 Tax=Rickettsia australis (strain Cutlack) TaxID=1105110 RepID=H8K8K8_RICAC|nr:hypothetical protein [Rickettsia australis]AFC71601.1 ankyrin repeat-containing protein [Rickettsia australis str. Cutlack]